MGTAMVTGIMDTGMVGTTIIVMATTGMIGLTVGAMEIATGMMIAGRGLLTVEEMVLVGIRVTVRMSPLGMAITLIPTSASPLGMAGIRAPIIIMAIRSLVPKPRLGPSACAPAEPPQLLLSRWRREDGTPTGGLTE
jgi:hypothetical protein